MNREIVIEIEGLDTYLTQIDRMVSGDGHPCDMGCSSQAIDKMIALAKELAPGKPYCHVKDWTWVDINVTKALSKKFQALGRIPAFIYSRCVVFDEAQRPHIDRTVRSTFLLNFHQNCIFITANTCYLLEGTGTRSSIDPEALRLLCW